MFNSKLGRKKISEQIKKHQNYALSKQSKVMHNFLLTKKNLQLMK